MNKEHLQDLVEELDGIYCDISTSKEFAEIIEQETEPPITSAQAEFAYKRLRVLQAVYNDRMRMEEHALEEIVKKFKTATA